MLSASGCFQKDKNKEKQSTFEKITGQAPMGPRKRWDSFFDTHIYVFGKQPAKFLEENIQKLPVGRALDIAMSEGRNTVFLAKKGFQVDGVDISEVAQRKARRLAKEYGVKINTINADLTTYKIKPNYYEAIVDFGYLQRSLFPQIKAGLKEGGVIVFEGHTKDQLKNEPGANPDFLLEKGELKKIFDDFEILHYSETNDGKEALARLLAKKPKISRREVNRTK